MTAERWILDGSYLSTLEKRLAQCDTVFFLDYSVEGIMENDLFPEKGKNLPKLYQFSFCCVLGNEIKI